MQNINLNFAQKENGPALFIQAELEYPTLKVWNLYYLRISTITNCGW